MLGGGAAFYYSYVTGWRPNRIHPFSGNNQDEMANYFNSDSFRDRSGVLLDDDKYGNGFEIPVVPQPDYDVEERM